jgi:endonuclease/exonuclease/phosphatase family metal-dependent hydrolase
VPLTLITHNVYWMQGMPFQGKNPGPGRREIIDGLAALYRSLAPDVICLQEVQSEEAAQDIFSTLKVRGHYTRGGTFPQYGGSVLCNFADVVSRAENVERHWTKVRVMPADSSPLNVCSVHLPFGADKQNIRIAELQVMVSSPPRPEIVCGDFNSLMDSEVHAEMVRQGYVDCAIESGCEHIASTTNPSGRRIDYVWIDSSLRNRLKGYRVIGAERLDLGGGRFLSDHLPVLVNLH